MKIKNFPLQFTEDKLNNIREAAKIEGVPMYEFMHAAIDERIANTGNKKNKD